MVSLGYDVSGHFDPTSARQTLTPERTPAMALSEAEVRHVAMLARLALDDEQIATLRVELNSILGHIDTLQQLDLDGVEPMTHAIPVVNQTRADIARPGLSRELALLNAPESEDDAFKIPRIVGTSEEG